MIDNLLGLDENIFLSLNSNHSPFWDFFMFTVTGKIIWAGLYLSILYSLWRAYGIKVMLIVLVSSCLVVLFADQITASMLRPWVARFRPSHPDNPLSEMVHIVNDHRGGAYGFPSSHAANTFGVATLLSLVFRQWRFTIGIFFWALLNCYSRIYLGLHYPGDLLGGGLIGVIFGLLIYFLMIFFLRISGTGMLRRPQPVIRVCPGVTRFYPSDISVSVEAITILAVLIVDFFI